jgi:hypothetical protein
VPAAIGKKDKTMEPEKKINALQFPGYSYSQRPDYLSIEEGTALREHIGEVERKFERVVFFCDEFLPFASNVQKRFDDLKRQWIDETQHLSSIREKSMHPAYQQIIGMGALALKFIFNDMNTEPNYWFWALRAITGQDPVTEGARGDINAMTKNWLAWATDKGYLHG